MNRREFAARAAGLLLVPSWLANRSAATSRAINLDPYYEATGKACFVVRVVGEENGGLDFNISAAQGRRLADALESAAKPIIGGETR